MKRSVLLQLLELGDIVMADHGFDINGIMPDGTGVNIPLFLGCRPQFDEDELVATRRIPTLPIHV